MQIIESSATPNQAYNLTLAFQRTLGIGLPSQITTEPTLRVLGSCFQWTSPNLKADHARALLAEYDRLERGVFGGPTKDTEVGPLLAVENVARAINGLLSEHGENPEYDRACVEIGSDLGIEITTRA